ncbi:hypothetical protein H4S07_004453 [Coemansia furcata]|uniref:Uncharacterized protein n=1 Tax=Coemansia furcata TaxID=417177 RepID=A0ACC1L9K2_9FUNG|nr:hypothetical protein H4S07_004453 [Coemansia furcata]
MVDRMVGFIKEHYPVPVPVNYRAVSNFMWISMDDCIRMHDMLQGKFKWTESDFERAAALRARGLTYKEAARHLSPTLTVAALSGALKRYLSSKPAPESISADELGEISRLVDEYAGKYPVSEIVATIRRQLNLSDRRNYYSLIGNYLAKHPHYRAKVCDIDFNDLTNRVATGQTTVKLAAKELDIPSFLLASRVRNLDAKRFPLIWTEEEIRKLIDYAQSCDSKPDMVLFSKLLGTKSSNRCRNKLFYLRQKGILPSAKDMVK